MKEGPTEGGERARPSAGGERPEEEGLALADASALRRELRAAVVRLCPPYLADRADDLIQGALMRVLAIQRRREGTAAFTSLYLKKVAYCALVDELRRQRRKREVPLEAEEEELHLPASAEPDPERVAASRESGRAIRKCLGEMIRPRRLAVTAYLQGHGTADVGRLLGWTAKRAENLIYRGLADLRECLTRQGVERSKGIER